MRRSSIVLGVVGAFVAAASLLSADLPTAPPVIVGVAVEGGPRTGTLEIQLRVSIARDPAEYRAWEKGEAEPAGWMPLAPPVSGRIYAIPFTLKAAGGASGSTRVVYLRVRNAAGESRLGGTRVGLSVPRIVAATPLGGARVPSPEVVFQARIGGGPTEYRAWEKGQMEPPGWIPVEVVSSTTFLLPYTLDAAGFTAGARRVVYLKARNEVGESRAFATQVLVSPPVIAAMGPTSAAAGSSEEIVLRGSFGAADGPASVTFDGVPAEIVSWTAAEIRCLVPLNVQGGIVPVVVTSQSGLQSAARRFQVRDFWAHTWTGEYEAEKGWCPPEHGWLIVSMTRRTDGKVSVRLQDGRVLVGAIVETSPKVYRLDATGSQADGSQMALIAVMDNTDGDACLAEGRYAWSDPYAGTSGSGMFDLRCPPPRVAPDGVYVVLPGDTGCSDCGETELMPVSLLKVASAGGRVSATGLVVPEAYSGTLEGTTFYLRGSYDRVAGAFSLDDEQNVRGFEGALEWMTPYCEGWEEFEGFRSTGASGAPDGTTCWDLAIESDFGEVLDGEAEATISGNRIAIQLAVLDEGEVMRMRCVGYIYDAPELGPGGFFVAKYSSLLLFGYCDPKGRILEGRYILGYEDFGGFDGSLVACP